MKIGKKSKTDYMFLLETDSKYKTIKEGKS